MRVGMRVPAESESTVQIIGVATIDAIARLRPAEGSQRAARSVGRVSSLALTFERVTHRRGGLSDYYERPANRPVTKPGGDEMSVETDRLKWASQGRSREPTCPSAIAKVLTPEPAKIECRCVCHHRAGLETEGTARG